MSHPVFVPRSLSLSLTLSPVQDLRLNSRCFMNDLRVVKFMQFLQVGMFVA